jgi:Cu(I)/Ag(I) efflux system membrane fusion protein
MATASGASNESVGQHRKRLASLIGRCLLGIAVLGLLIWGLLDGGPPQELADSDIVWTCSMHPEVQLPQPGICPKCPMALYPISRDELAESGQLVVSREALALMDVETTPVRRLYPTAEIRMFGKVDYDETRLTDITAWVPGRLDRLFVDYPGIVVNQGDHMVEIYSPELLIAQQELLQGIQSLEALSQSSSSLVRDSTQAMVEASRAKLRLLGVTEQQIRDIEESGLTSEQMTIYSPASGIVIDVHAQEGGYVDTGTPIYTVADLSQVWIELDAYESDLAWLRYGQDVEFTTISHPGETFSGTIVFIDPILNTETRTVHVRVNASNEDGRLKPGMFVTAVAHSQLAADGAVLRPDLRGMWISPMHPEIIRDEPGVCDVCGMDLVPAESLGYAEPDDREVHPPLVIPTSAALITGRRAVVYAQVPDTPLPTFEGRQVVLGPRAGDLYIVAEGLEEGERVVTRGAFKIDSALQIHAEPSMMAPEGTVAPPTSHLGHEGHE